MAKQTNAQLQARVAELEAELAKSADEHVTALEAQVAGLQQQLADAETALGEAPAPVVDTRPEPGTPVWVRGSDGREWHVEAGSSTYETLLEQGGAVYDPDDEAAE